MSVNKADFTPPLLRTERTIMRCIQQRDFESSAALWADPKVVKYISGKPSTQEESWNRLLRNIGHWQVFGFGKWTVEDKVTGDFLGEIGLTFHKRNIAPDLDTLPEIGWVLASRAHGKGLATETVQALLQWSDQNLDFHKTYCIVSPENVASQRIAQKNGYEKSSNAAYHEQPILVMIRDNSSQSVAH